MKSVTENLQVFLVGAVCYSGAEIFFRGFTHWTMSLTGGLCLLILYHLFHRLESSPLWKKCLLGALIITGLEFTVGCVVNLLLDWNVWDYSNYPWNLLGQICLIFTLLWFLLSAPLVWLTDQLRKTTRRELRF